MSEEEKEEEPSQKEEESKVEKLTREATIALKEGVSSLQKDTKARKVFMGNIKARWAWGYWAVMIVALLIYGIVGYLVISHIVEPALVSVYDFTVKEGEQIAIVLEAEIISNAVSVFIGILIGRRLTRKDSSLDYQKLAQAMVIALDERDKRKEKEDEN